MKQLNACAVKYALIAGSLFVVAIAIPIPISAADGARAGVPDDPTGVRASVNVNVTHKKGAQGEASVTVDPTNPLHVLTSVNDFTSTAAVYESMDGGRSYAKSTFRPDGTCDSTWVTFNAHGDAFFSYECPDERIAYKKKGAKWTEVKLAIAGTVPDRDMVVVDNASASPYFGSVYVGYDDDAQSKAPYVLYSRDGFTNWQRSPQLQPGVATIGVNVATGPGGEVYASWEDYTGGKIWSAKSSDGGATWSKAHLVTKYRMNTATFFVFIPPQNIRGIIPFPMTAVAQAGKHAGRLFASYTDNDAGGRGTSIYVRYSDDGGVTWSDEVKVNDDAKHGYHFHPSIAVLPNGTVGISFYDTRRDSSNRKTDRFFSSSTDGGKTWSQNLRITGAQSDETRNGSDKKQYGEYQGMAASGKKFYAAWTDSREPGSAGEDVFSSSVAP